MDGNRFTVSIHLHGTLAANALGAFQLPCGATLEAVSACGSNVNSATLQIGTSADADGVLVAGSIGDNSVPALFSRGGFDGALVQSNQFPHFAKGAVLNWLLDFDGAAGTAAANVQIIFYFLEG